MVTKNRDAKADSKSESATGTQPSNSRQATGSINVGSVVLIAVAIAAAFMATALAIVFVQRSVGSLVQTTQPTITTKPIISVGSAQASYEDLIVTQRMVIESTSRAVESINRTADLMLTLNAFLFTVMTAAGAGALWRANTASDKAESAERQAKDAAEQAEKAKKTLRDTEESFGDLQQQMTMLQQKIVEADQAIKDSRKLAREVSDRQKRVATLLQLDVYGMDMRSGDTDRLWKAISAAKAMSQWPDAIIRRKAVKVLGSLEECDMEVIEWLEEISVSDQARGVRQEAEEALEKLRRLCDETNTEQDERPAPG